MPAFHQTGGVGTGRRDHLRRRHPPIAQEPPKANLACAIATKRPHPDPALANRHQTLQKKRPLFPGEGRQNSPGSAPCIIHRCCVTAIDSEDPPRRKGEPDKTCVHVLGPEPTIYIPAVVRRWSTHG